MSVQNIIIGFLLATVGITVLNCLSDIITTISELIKAVLSMGIIYCNNKINNSTREQKSDFKNRIGFNIETEEDDDNAK